MKLTLLRSETDECDPQVRVLRVAARITFLAVAALAFLSFVLWIISTTPAPAREHYLGQYAQVDPAIGDWFKGQQVPNKGYPCCSEADGTKAEEDIRDGHLWTRFFYTSYDYTGVEEGEDAKVTENLDSGWMEVPDDAIIRDGKPNPMGGPVVWYRTEGSQGDVVRIRCFKPSYDF